jgi:hypothetical protein
MDRVLTALMDLVVPPASMVMLAFAWPTLAFLRAAEWAVKALTKEDMRDKVVLVTGASSAIGEQVAYEYARRGANLVLVARREHRLFAVRDNARALGAGQVLIVAADVVREDDCRRLVADTISYFGQRECNELFLLQNPATARCRDTCTALPALFRRSCYSMRLPCRDRALSLML